jgi:hypothetical protein
MLIAIGSPFVSAMPRRYSTACVTRLDPRGLRHARLFLGANGRVEILFQYLGSVTELARRIAAVPSLVPYGQESSCPVALQEIGMSEIEATHVDDSDDEILAASMRRRDSYRFRTGLGGKAGDGGMVELERVGWVNKCNGRIAIQCVQHRYGNRRRDDVPARHSGGRNILRAFLLLIDLGAHPLHLARLLLPLSLLLLSLRRRRLREELDIHVDE